VIDVSSAGRSGNLSSIADYFIIATSASIPQTNAISKAMEDGLRGMGFKVPRWEGKAQSNWLILDLGSIIVHIMGAEERKKYSLEEMWGRSGITYHI